MSASKRKLNGIQWLVAIFMVVISRHTSSSIFSSLGLPPVLLFCTLLQILPLRCPSCYLCIVNHPEHVRRAERPETCRQTWNFNFCIFSPYPCSVLQYVVHSRLRHMIPIRHAVILSFVRNVHRSLGEFKNAISTLAYKQRDADGTGRYRS